MNRKPLPSEIEERTIGLITGYPGLNIKCPERGMIIPKLKDISSSAPYYIILLFSIIVLGIIILSLFL